MGGSWSHGWACLWSFSPAPYKLGLRGRPQPSCVGSGYNSHQQLGYLQLAGDPSGTHVHYNPVSTEAILGSTSGLPVPLDTMHVLRAAAALTIITAIADVNRALTPTSQGPASHQDRSRQALRLPPSLTAARLARAVVPYMMLRCGDTGLWRGVDTRCSAGERDPEERAGERRDSRCHHSPRLCPRDLAAVCPAQQLPPSQGQRGSPAPPPPGSGTGRPSDFYSPTVLGRGEELGQNTLSP